MVVPPDHTVNAVGYWICVGRNQLLMQAGDAGLVFPQGRAASEFGIVADHEHFLGLLDGVPVWAAGIDSPHDDLDGFRYESLFTLYSHMDEELWALAGKALQIAEWDRTHRFCGRCGEPTAIAPGERARKCQSCGLLAFPRIAPAIITAVSDGDRILLARGRGFGTPMYSTIAGFVEPGETLEECVAREVKEEVGVDVTNIVYQSSQPWPFPHSLMLGFTADYAGGEICCQESEIQDAQWFTADNMPNIPGKLSIARRLIDGWLRTQGVVTEDDGAMDARLKEAVERRVQNQGLNHD
jgi:NAD+ diphosphatase